jgi:UTP--glucose-1-phosphate uridylyltransferase
MLPLVDKPLIQYAVEESVASGIESILIVTGRDKTAIEDHFDISFEMEQMLKSRGKDEMFELVRAVSDLAKISYTRQKEALGLGHAIYQAKGFAGEDPFAVLLADDIVDAEVPALKQMMAVYEKYDAPVVATMQVEGEAISRFGVIAEEGAEELHSRVAQTVRRPELNRAVGVLQIARDRAGAEVDPPAHHRVADESVVPLVRVTGHEASCTTARGDLPHRRFTWPRGRAYDPVRW